MLVELNFYYVLSLPKKLQMGHSFKLGFVSLWFQIFLTTYNFFRMVSELQSFRAEEEKVPVDQEKVALVASKFLKSSTTI